jgi:hypothetical protein
MANNGSGYYSWNVSQQSARVDLIRCRTNDSEEALPAHWLQLITHGINAIVFSGLSHR